MATEKIVADSGPAFPCFETLEAYDNDAGKYREVMAPVGGMSLRDYFAGQALVGIIASHSGPDVKLPNTAMASMTAYDFAEAMIAERAK